MTKGNNHDISSSSPGITRRRFLRLAAMAGLLTGCRPVQQLTATPTQAPTATSPPTPTTAPTATPTVAPTATATTAPTATPTAIAAPTATPTVAPPSEPSAAVIARHAGVWNGDTPVPGAIRQLLDASVAALTGVDEADAAWASLFAPHERIAIKVNTYHGDPYTSYVPLVMGVTERLQEVGVPAGQIVIYDISNDELMLAGFPVNTRGTGVRCHGSSSYSGDWMINNVNIAFSNILLECDALINMPILKNHFLTGITFAMKNHFGSFDNPAPLHDGIGNTLAEVNALPPLRERTRLIIGNALEVVPSNWNRTVPYDAILMSRDPVTHDTVGVQVYSDVRGTGTVSQGMARLTGAWLGRGAELGLGVNNLDDIDLIELSLG